jgi:hypothetical protein
MELLELTGKLIGGFLFTHLSALAVRHDGRVEKMHVEHVTKAQLLEAVQIYQRMARKLLASE